MPFFENRKKVPDFGKKMPLKFNFKSIYERISKTSPCGALLTFVRDKMFITIIPKNLPWPKKFLVARLYF